MKASRNMSLAKTNASTKPMGWQLAMAFLIGMLVQHALASDCFAGDEDAQSSTSQLIAAMPEEGAPPAPAVAADAQASLPSLTDENAAASDNKVTADARLPGELSAETPAVAAPADSTSSSSSSESAPDIASEVRELSVSPETRPLLPEGRPSWVGAPPDLSNPRRHRLFVGSFPTSSIDEVDAALDEPMLAAVNGYIEEEVLEAGGAAHLNITADFIRRNLLDSSTEYVAELNTSTGPAYQKWVVLEITPDHRQHFLEAHREFEQRKRLVGLGLGVASILGLTGVAHLAFDRRRRRYARVGQPIVHTVAAESDPVAAKGNNRALWLLAGGAGSLAMLGALLLGSVSVVHRAERVDSVILGSEQTIYPDRPPTPPRPPMPTQIHSTPEVMHTLELHKSHEWKPLKKAWEPIDAEQNVVELRSDRD